MCVLEMELEDEKEERVENRRKKKRALERKLSSMVLLVTKRSDLKKTTLKTSYGEPRR